MYFVI
jgi:hypothetical protein